MVEDKKSLKFAGHCNGAICEGEHFVYSFGIHHMVLGTGADRAGRMYVKCYKSFIVTLKEKLM